MSIAYIKKLVHDDGADFVIWHPNAGVYCPVLCDDDIPPDPEYLDLNLGPESVTLPQNLSWRLTGEAYDTQTGARA